MNAGLLLAIFMEGEGGLVKELVEKHALPILLREFSMISEYSQLAKVPLLLQVLGQMTVDKGVMQSLPALLRNSAVKFLDCDSADFSVRFTGYPQGHLASVFAALMPIYKAHASDDDICSLLEAFNCDDIRSHSTHKPPVVQAYAMEFVRELLQVKVCELEELTQVKRLTDSLFSDFYFLNDWVSSQPHHYEVQEEANANHHGNILLLLQCPAAPSVLAALESSLNLSSQAYVQRLFSFLNYFLSQTSYFVSIAKRGDFIVKLASAADKDRIGLQVLGLCLQKPDLANELDKVSDLYLRLLKSEEYFNFAITDLTRVFRMMDPESHIFNDFEIVFKETEDPDRLAVMAECISGVIDTCENQVTRQRLQDAYISTLPIAVLQAHWRTKHGKLPIALSMLLRSILNNHRSKHELTKKLTLALVSYLTANRSATASFLEDLLITIFGAETLDQTHEVELPELIDCFLELIKSCRDDALIVQMLRHLQGLMLKSLYNIACFSRFGGKILEIAEAEGRRNAALELVQLCGSYYVWPTTLRKFLDMLYDSSLTGDHELAGCLLQALIPIGRNEARLFKRSVKGKRPLPLNSLHLSSPDSVFKSSLLTFFERGLTISFWIFPQTHGTVVTIQDDSLKIVLSIDPSNHLEVLVVKGNLAVSLPNLGEVCIDEWCFIGFTVTDRFVSLHVNSKTYPAEEVRCTFADVLSVNLGSCYARSTFMPSFMGEIANVLVLKGSVTEEVLNSLHYTGFEGCNLLPQFKKEATWYEDFAEPHKRNLESIKTLATHFLDLSSYQPKLNSFEAVSVQDFDRNPRVTQSNVKVCGGPSLLEAFHQIGGLKVWLFFMDEVSRASRSSSFAVPAIETYKLLNDLLEQGNYRTCLEVSAGNLFDLVSALLRRWKEKGICGVDTFKRVVESARISWLYKRCANVMDRDTEATLLSYRRHPGALRLVFSFKLWRDIDQEKFFEEVAALTEVTTNYECHTAMHMHLLDYYMSLARHSPGVLEALKLKYQDRFFKTLRSYMNLRSLLMLLLYERSKSLSTAAIQLVLELTGSFSMAEFSAYIGRNDKRLRSLLKNLYDLTVMLSLSEGTTDCLRYVGFTVEKIFNLTISVGVSYTRSESDVPALSLCEELVFKLAEVSSRHDTVRLIEHYVDQCQALNIPFDFGRLLKIYFVCWVNAKDMEILRFAAAVLDQQFTKGAFDRSYERLYVTCEEGLSAGSPLADAAVRGDVEGEGLTVEPDFGEFLLGLMMCLATSEVSSTTFRLLIYWAEDLQKHLKVKVPVDLLRRLLDLAVAQGVQHEIEPFIPRFSWVSPILTETVRPKVRSFARREGGVLRILLSLPLRAMLTENPSDCVLLIRDLLDLRIPESYLRLKFPGSAEASMNFFADDLNVVAYASGELLEMLYVRSDLRTPEVYSLAIDLVLAIGNNLLNCLDLHLNAEVKFYEFLLANFSKLSGGICQHNRTLLLYPVSRNPLTREERSSLMGFEGKLKEIARKKQYDLLEQQLLDRSSDLARLHDFLVAYACMKLKAIEQVKPTFLFVPIKTPKFYSKNYLPTSNEQATEQLFYEKTRHNKNMQDFGATRLAKLLRKLTLEFQLNSNYYTPRYWKISPVVDALGRKMRLVPNSKGSSYLDKTNSLYLEAPTVDKASINADDILSNKLSQPLLLGSILNRRSVMPLSGGAELANPWFIERHDQSTNPHGSSDNLAASATIDCEHIRGDTAVFGELEVSADCIVFRSQGSPRPEKYDLAALKSSLEQRRYAKIWLTREVSEVVHKKFMQQRTAIEIYTTSGQSYLFNLYSIQSVRKVVPFFSDKFKTSTNESIQPWTKLWRAGQLSNFEYLMKLNKYSGRSYNDLGQYPVFPWVLANYSAPLSFTESDFRDFSWPIGAIDERSRSESVAKYEEFEHDVDLMPYHYGSHYSNMGITVHYLLRAEPFTKQAISFQDNHFDVADRLFYSIQVSWENSTLATGDYKEMVPEFFALPEVVLNMHRYNLGWRQTGEIVDDVELPSWACPGEAMSPYNFVYWHRRALEHSFVSRNLHKWIDLIFGCKHEDKDSVNVFLPLTYEHHFSEQLALCDAEKFARETLLIQIAHFGQTPSKLFDKPHEQRLVDRREASIFKDFDAASISDERGLKGLVRTVSTGGNRDSSTIILALLRRRTASCVVFEQNSRQFALFFEESQSDWLSQLGNLQGGCELERMALSGQPMFYNFALTDGKVLIASCYADSSFRFYNTIQKSGKISVREAVYFHSAQVTCLDYADEDLLATADSEGVIAVWKLDFKAAVLCTFRGVLRSQSVGIKQVVISCPLQLVMSLDLEGCIFLHDLRSCELVNILRPDCIPTCAAVSSLGMIAVATHDEAPKIQLYSLCGGQGRPSLKIISGSQSEKYQKLRNEQGFESDSVSWIKFSSTGDYLMTTGTSTFCIWPAYETSAPYVLPCNSQVRAVAVDTEERSVLLHSKKRDFILVKQ